MTTVRDWLLAPLPIPHNDESGYHTTSKKTKAKKYDPITNYTFYKPEELEVLLGGSEHEWDTTRLNRDIGSGPPLHLPENIRTEADTRRYWCRYISSTIMQAFLGSPATLEEMGEQAASSNEAETVDDSYCFMDKDWLKFAAIVEHKKAGVIRPNDWIQKKDTASRLRLSTEARMYADIYGSPQVIIMDARYILLILFRVGKASDIAETGAQTRVSIFGLYGSYRTTDPPWTASYAAYRLISQGVDRVMASRSSDSLIVEGYTRVFDYYNGTPRFNTTDGNAPLGVNRVWSIERQAWYWRNDRSEFLVWDTLPLRNIVKDKGTNDEEEDEDEDEGEEDEYSAQVGASFSQLQVSQSEASSSSQPTASGWLLDEASGEYYIWDPRKGRYVYASEYRST